MVITSMNLDYTLKLLKMSINKPLLLTLVRVILKTIRWKTEYLMCEGTCYWVSQSTPAVMIKN